MISQQELANNFTEDEDEAELAAEKQKQKLYIEGLACVASRIKRVFIKRKRNFNSIELFRRSDTPITIDLLKLLDLNNKIIFMETVNKCHDELQLSTLFQKLLHKIHEKAIPPESVSEFQSAFENCPIPMEIVDSSISKALQHAEFRIPAKNKFIYSTLMEIISLSVQNKFNKQLILSLYSRALAHSVFGEDKQIYVEILFYIFSVKFLGRYPGSLYEDSLIEPIPPQEHDEEF